MNCFHGVLRPVEHVDLPFQDCLLHVLPLHHTHGIVNCLLCPVAVGGSVNMLQNFDPEKIWNQLLSDETSESRVNVFMAVPTVYAKLIEYYHQNLDAQNLFLGKSKEAIRKTCEKNIRLMVSGSAALPQVFKTPGNMSRKASKSILASSPSWNPGRTSPLIFYWNVTV